MSVESTQWALTDLSNFVRAKGLQAYYPNQTSLARDRGRLGLPNGLDFLPLEVLLDTNSQSTDYDRVVARTDAAVSYDKFNHLRVPRGMDWPNASDAHGPITHLRMHRASRACWPELTDQDHIVLTVPRVQLEATRQHYHALLTVVTDLCSYKDATHRARSDQVNAFIFAFDRKDRDPQHTLSDISSLQSHVRSLSELQVGYEANLDRLTTEGVEELARIRQDIYETSDQLYTIFDAVTIAFSRDDARAALKTAQRMDIRIGTVIGKLLRDDMTPIITVEVAGTLFTHIGNKDGSAEWNFANANVIASNSDANAYFHEVLVRYNDTKVDGGNTAVSFPSCSSVG